jgi:hypothetical protein
MPQKFANNSQVRIEGSDTVYTVKQYHQGVNKYLVQLGSDGSKTQWEPEDKLVPVEQSIQSGADETSQMVPPKSITDVGY